MVDTERVMEDLQRAGQLRAESLKLRTEAAAILSDAVPQALKADISVTEIARVAHLSRQAVYNLTRSSE